MDAAGQFASVPPEIFLPVIVLVAVVVYCLGILVAIVICYAKYPERLKQSAAPTGLSQIVISYMDCSPILSCLPCSECSFRRVLRNCCPNTESLRRLVNCECIRPPLQGSPQGVDLVCCMV
ncbi:hypothetical protein Q1695_016013 [Nippostrongylus brasiliensis]|nr:hypothetical protein Q1695_016013 [Nippostrongylus brasiliensis]